MADYRIRAHHGMCLAFFKGKGYSGEFTDHMGKMKTVLERNPKVRIINETDDICGHCPNNISGTCNTPDKVSEYDNKVLELCRLEPGAEMEWKAFEELVGCAILNKGRRKAVCGDCQWDSLCN